MAVSNLTLAGKPASLPGFRQVFARLPLVRLQIIDSKLLQPGAVHPKVRGFLHGAVGVPMIHGHALNEPHGGRASAARAMDEGWLGAFRGYDVEKLVRGGGIGRTGIEGDALVSQARGLCGRTLIQYVRAGLGRLPQIDD
jgi:hypothetical protein